MSNNPTLIAGFEDFLSYIKNQDAIIKNFRDLQVEHQKADEQIQKLNKELVAQKDAEIAKLKEELDVWVNPKGEVVMNQMGVMLYEGTREENKKLKEKLTTLSGQYELAIQDVKQGEEEIKKLKKTVEEQREEIKYSTLLTAEVVQDQCPEELKHLCTDEKAQKICDKYKEGVATYLYEVLDDTCEADIDYEEELGKAESEDEDDDADKYDGDEWGWVYGKNIVEQEDEETGEEYKEVVLCMAGGGDHWENYIMTPTMNYIENKYGKYPDSGFLVQSSCGNYVSFQDKDYKCDDGEIICEYDDCVVE